MATDAAAPAPAEGGRQLDPFIWKACAGSSVGIPDVDSVVYYFPQGHAEQASAVPDFSSVSCNCSFFVCRVSGVEFLANRETDEVYAKISLYPLDARIFGQPAPAPAPAPDSYDNRGGIVSFSKTLTPSDANNGGGFSVPRFCADSIFPPLNLQDDPPVQMISITDVHGTVWVFRHIYRGTPRRYLLTTGWSKFVNSKRLIAGDSVVFIKNPSGQLFVGVRRAVRSGVSATRPEERLGGGDGFWRSCSGRVPPETVVEAVRLAGMSRPFEVMYYPRAGFPEFVVRRELVEKAMRVIWRPEMRVKMAVKTEEQSRVSWFQGKVSRGEQRALRPFPLSPWRMLEISWDESQFLQNKKGVSPWLVELVSDAPQISSTYPAIKKYRLSQEHEFFTDGAERNMFTGSGFTSTMMESKNSSPFGYKTYPAGMQGARHDLINGSHLSNLVPNVTHQMFPEDLNSNCTQPKVNPVSTEVNMRITSQSESSSPPSHDSVHCFGVKSFDNSACKTAKKVYVSFQLFGQTIQTKQPVDGDLNEGHKENEIAGGHRHLPVSYPKK